MWPTSKAKCLPNPQQQQQQQQQQLFFTICFPLFYLLLKKGPETEALTLPGILIDFVEPSMVLYMQVRLFMYT